MLRFVLLKIIFFSTQTFFKINYNLIIPGNMAFVMSFFALALKDFVYRVASVGLETIHKLCRHLRGRGFSQNISLLTRGEEGFRKNLHRQFQRNAQKITKTGTFLAFGTVCLFAIQK